MYQTYFGLKKSPFHITSDPEFLYLSRSHQEGLSHLMYGIQQKKGFLSIVGEVGTGKTTLCRALFRQLPHRTKFAFIFNSGLSETDLLAAILEDFGVKVRNHHKIDLFNSLNQFLIQQMRHKYNVVLVIDEAQNLSIDTLEQIRMLSNLETEKEKLFQIILVGQPELGKKLDLPELRQLKQRIAVRYEIKPLEEDEISSYIYHRLTVAGLKKELFFTTTALKKIYEYSQGIPRIINMVCDKTLLQGYVIETRIVTEGMVDQAIQEIEGRI